MWDQEILCVLPNDLQTTLGIFMLEPRNRSKSHAKTKPILFRLVNCNYFLVKPILYEHKNTLTLIGMREGTFHPLSFLDQSLSAEFLSKISNSKRFGT